MFLTDVMYASRPTLYNASLHGVLSHPRNYDVKTQPKRKKNKTNIYLNINLNKRLLPTTRAIIFKPRQLRLV